MIVLCLWFILRFRKDVVLRMVVFGLMCCICYVRLL